MRLHRFSFLGVGIGAMLITASAWAAAPTVTCSTNMVLECSAATNVNVWAYVQDLDGDLLTLLWEINGEPVSTNTIAAGDAVNVIYFPLTYTYSRGTNLVRVGVTDGQSVASCTTTVIVRDTTPPVVRRIRAVPEALWPPNHKMVPVQLRVNGRDECGDIRWRILSVRSNEPVTGRGDGNTRPDWIIRTNRNDVLLRAERSGRGTGRIYTMLVEVRDDSRNVTEHEVEVRVPKSSWPDVRDALRRGVFRLNR